MKKEQEGARLQFAVGWKEANKVEKKEKTITLYEYMLENYVPGGRAFCACGEPLTREEEVENLSASLAE